MSLVPGTRFGPYEVRASIGAGGMGEVYLARDPRLQRDVALKLLPQAVAADADRLRRFENEARSVSGLNHPAIVVVYELGQEDGQPFISMEFVQGQTLRTILESGAMTVRRALHVAAQVADGLAKAHDAGIVHRDLKPDNLMVTDDGFAKILDFGLAKLVADEGAEALLTVTGRATLPGSVMGTAGYMSPEQASGQPADSRSDQFSFGLVLYEMLTGRRAFDGSSVVEQLSAVIRDEARPIAEIAPSVPAPVAWIVERCLAKAPAERYASTRDLARDLASARAHLSELTTGSAAARSRGPARRWREPLAWTLAAVFALAAVAFAWWPLSRGATVAPRVVRFGMMPPDGTTFSAGVGSSAFAVSPDGQRLVFVTLGTGRPRQLWMRSFEATDAQPIAGTEGALNPFWSADGQSVAFFAEGRLKKVALTSGDVTTICEAGGGGGGAWNQDGTIVFAPGLDAALMRVPATGGIPVAATSFDSSTGVTADVSPLFLPDGRHFVFARIAARGEGTYVGSLDSREIHRLFESPAVTRFVAPDYLVYVDIGRLTNTGRLSAQRLDLNSLALVGDQLPIAEGVAITGPSVAFGASPGGTLVYWSGSDDATQPTWLSRDGTVLGTLGPPARYVNLAISPDGRQVAIDRIDNDPAILLLDVSRGTASRETSPGRRYQSTPVWSPDGQAIAFALAEDGQPTLFLKRVGIGVENTRLAPSGYQSFPQSWSPDGQFLVYVSIEPKTGLDIWRMPMRGEATPVAMIRTPFQETSPRISPDGRWIAYASNESGRWDVYVTRFPQPGQKWPISTAGGQFPIWRRDGRELYYRSPENAIMAAEVRGSEGDELTLAPPVRLFTPRPSLNGPGAGTFYDVAPDGRFLLNVFERRITPPATVVLNWPSAMAKTPR